MTVTVQHQGREGLKTAVKGVESEKQRLRAAMAKMKR
jgi:hypothetical protein